MFQIDLNACRNQLIFKAMLYIFYNFIVISLHNACATKEDTLQGGIKLMLMPCKIRIKTNMKTLCVKQ